MWKSLTLLLCLIASIASAASVQWNASVVDAEHGVPDGYRVYYGYAVDQLTTAYDVGAELNFVIPETWNPATYYFGVRAYNQSGESGWATTPEGQTWVAYVKADPPPVLPPAPATDVRIVWEQIEDPTIMAAEYISSEVWTTGNLTVPTDATAAVVFTFAYPASYPTALSIGSSTRDGESHSTSSGNFGCAVSWVLSPPTGSQALSITWSATNQIGPGVVVMYIKGVDSVRDSGAATADDGDDAVVVDSTATDLVLGLAANYGSYIAAPSGWTSRVTQTNLDAYMRGLTCDSPGASTTTLNLGVYGSEWYYGVAAISFVASGGGSSAVPVIMRSYRARRN